MLAASPLTAVFLTHLGGAAGERPVSATLEARLQGRYEAGAAAWPGLDLAAPVYAQHLAERLADEPDPEECLDALNAADLYLACACQRGVPGAVEAFDRGVMAHVPAFVQRVDSSPAFADEVRQILREKLFVGVAGVAPRIADYSGRGNLLKWMRVAAVRTALNLRMQRDRQFREGHKPGLAPALVGERDPELDYIKGRHRIDFQEAFQGALGALSSEQRNLLRLRFVDGVSIERLADLFQIHRATLLRKLAAARSEVHDQTRLLLQERVRLSASEFDHLAKLVRSQLNVSIGQFLKSSQS